MEKRLVHNEYALSVQTRKENEGGLICKELVDAFGDLVDDLVVDAFGCGNETMAINSVGIEDHLYPLSRKERTKARHKSQNAAFMSILHQGWPFVFLVTKKSVSKGEEVLIDYGDAYWEEQEALCAEYKDVLDNTDELRRTGFLDKLRALRAGSGAKHPLSVS
jgi:hypothetical protein